MLFFLLIIQSLVVHGKQRNTGKKSRMMEVRLPSIWPTRTARCTHAHVHKQLGFDRFASYLGAVNIGHLRGPPPCTLQNCHLYNLQSSILKSKKKLTPTRVGQDGNACLTCIDTGKVRTQFSE